MGPYFSGAPLESFDGPSVLQWALVAIFIYLFVIFYYDGHNILNSMRNFRGTRECSRRRNYAGSSVYPTEDLTLNT